MKPKTAQANRNPLLRRLFENAAIPTPKADAGGLNKGPATPTEPPASIDPLNSPKVVAQGLGLAEQTLANWRSTGRVALPYLKVGRLVRYRRSVWTRMAEAPK